MCNLLNRNSKIYIAGHRGMVGSAIFRKFETDGYTNIITQSSKALDLRNQASVKDFFSNTEIDYVVLAAAKVGGISANCEYPAQFIYDNLMIETNIIHQAYMNGVNRLLFLGSSCIYPKFAEQPMQECALLTSELEPTNEPYAIAKIAGIKLCESYNRQYGTHYRSVMPTNLYGENDNFHPENSHVIPGLIRRIYEAKQAGDMSILIWGSGNAKREFLYVEEMADACIHVMKLNDEEYASFTHQTLSHLNVGTGQDITIRELAELLKNIIGYKGELLFDTSKPDGPPRKLLDVSQLELLGWKNQTSLYEGLERTYRWFQKRASVVIKE